MGSAVPDLKALKWPFKDPKFIFFTDFDGTITLQDSNDYMTDNVGYGQTRRKAEFKEVLEGRAHFRDAFRTMMDSVELPFDECVDMLVKNVKLDPHFNEYFQWALQNNIPTVVVSSGMTPIIRAILRNLVGPDADKLDIVCNEAVPRDGKSLNEKGGWKIQYHDDSGFGHDKSLTLRPYAQLPAESRPTIFYAGDGVSDLSAAREADLLFAKRGHDLVWYCAKENVPFTTFPDWSTILEKVKEIHAGKTSVKDAAKKGYDEFLEGEAGIKPTMK